MFSLPYEFDTAEPWERIVKTFLLVGGVYVAMVIGLFLEGRSVAGIFALLFGLAFWLVIRRVPREIGMGARGRLSATEVVTRGVRVWRYALNVPVGRFAIDKFSEVAVVERVVVMRPDTGAPRGNTGSVRLVGRNGTPNVDILLAGIEAANAFARELSAALTLPLRELAAPGTTIVRISL